MKEKPGCTHSNLFNMSCKYKKMLDKRKIMEGKTLQNKYLCCRDKTNEVFRLILSKKFLNLKQN